MKAVIYREFAELPTIENLPDPTPPVHGVVLRVKATGLCRSDWHGWMGHDPDIKELVNMNKFTGSGVTVINEF